ncbi:unnamed protein product [Mycena citricolor]|uniref:Kinesin-like protein n=1 Tax=Mycena citricolor TaxID=2018698 RepID=A0AAD2JZ89_9AGAR|nr:unnamed protein product [Mycena citricolor]
MSATPSTKRAPFTPRTTRVPRTTSADLNELSSRQPRATAPSVVLPATKKYKAPLTREPYEVSTSFSRGIRDGWFEPCPRSALPQHNVEDSVVDFQTVGIDLTGDALAGDLSSMSIAAADVAVDKVMVSVRVRPGSNSGPRVWAISDDDTIQPSGEHGSAAPTPANRFTFDTIHTTIPTAPLYTTAARPHVHAFMSGYNAVVFAYGQTASGKTYTLTGTPEEPGIIPRALRDVFAFIRATPTREYLLRCSYLEIYNETIYDLLAPAAAQKGVEIQGSAAGGEIILAGLREEVVTSLANVKDVLKRGEANRRTASTDWNERSSRSHSVFRVVCESRERGGSRDHTEDDGVSNGRHTPGLSGRSTPGLGGPRLQAKGGRSVQSSVLSLIDLAGSERATSDKDRTREGRYINTSLLTLGTVISTLAENGAKGKHDHVPYRNSKLTRMLQPSLSGNARISVVCTINPDSNAVTETMSTLQFARRIKGVQLNAQKKEIVDTDALIEKYRKEIEDLKRRLEEREEEASRDAPSLRTRRLSAREQIDESKAMTDMNTRIKQLTKLILTSQTVGSGDDSRPASPVKVDFDMSPYQLQQELLAARLQLESQSNQILSLEASLALTRTENPDDETEDKDSIIAEQAKRIKELEAAMQSHGEPSDRLERVEQEWSEKLQRVVKEKETWANELVRELEKEKKMRQHLEEERRALAAFVTKFDSLGLGMLSAAASPVKPSPGKASVTFASRREARHQSRQVDEFESPMRMSLDLSSKFGAQPSLLEQMPEEEWDAAADASFEVDSHATWPARVGKTVLVGSGPSSPARIFGLSAKENVPTQSN